MVSGVNKHAGDTGIYIPLSLLLTIVKPNEIPCSRNNHDETSNFIYRIIIFCTCKMYLPNVTYSSGGRKEVISI